MRVRMCVCASVCMRARVCVCMREFVCVGVGGCVCVCVSVFVCAREVQQFVTHLHTNQLGHIPNINREI
jgi:hypothetical protein